MRYEIFYGDYIGNAEWVAPEEVAINVRDPEERAWFQNYFAAEDSVMAAAGDHDGMILERRDASEAAFNRAMYQLAGCRRRPGEREPRLRGSTFGGDVMDRVGIRMRTRRR